MHPEYLQIRRHAIAAILSNTKQIDPQTDLAAQHRTRTYNAIVIAGALTGILGNIDIQLASNFAEALGLGESHKATPTTHKNIHLASVLVQKKHWLTILTKVLKEEPSSLTYAVTMRELHQAQLNMLTLEIEQIEATLASCKVQA